MNKGECLQDFSCFSPQKMICISPDGFICPFLFNNSEFKRLKSPKLGLKDNENFSFIKKCGKQKFFAVVSNRDDRLYKIYLFFVNFEFEVNFFSYLSFSKICEPDVVMSDLFLGYKGYQHENFVLVFGFENGFSVFIMESNNLVEASSKTKISQRFKEFGSFVQNGDWAFDMTVLADDGIHKSNLRFFIEL